MRRRKFITLLGGMVAAWPLAARAQQAGIPVIGFLSSRSPGESAHLIEAFRRGLSEIGFVEGQNTIISFRWAEGRYDLLPALAAALVKVRPAVIVTAGGVPAALAGKAATSTIPVVFTAITDPVQMGVVQSLNQPGGNVTGIGSFSSATGGKRLGLLHELAPSARAIALLINPDYPGAAAERNDVQRAAASLGSHTLDVFEARTENDIESAFSSIRQSAAAVVVGTDPFFDSRRVRIVDLAARHAVPAMYPFREYVTAGGLISYGISISENYRQAGIYTGRLLSGAKVADLPVQLPTRFELVINVSTAKKLGISVPNSMQLLADEVIE